MKCLFFYSLEQFELISTLKMEFSLEHMFIIAAIFFLNIGLCFSACARAEYEINGECCPMCAPGSRVHRHCTEFISTTCVPCLDSTFTSKPNGLPNCFSCAVCDPGQGLRVKTDCTRTSDTVCEPLEGFYCTNDDRGSCTQAMEHTKCSPGQYIKQKGTEFNDAECADCESGTYSNGSFEICKQHTKCDDLGLTEIKPGTAMSDVECGKKSQFGIIIIIVCVMFAAVVLIAIILIKVIHKIGQCAVNKTATTSDRKPQKETGQDVELEITNSQTRFLP